MSILGSFRIMTDRITAAFELAFTLHDGSFRKGTSIPYIVHPMDVASNLIKSGASEDLVIAGLLHDIVEDEDYYLEVIEQQFGAEVRRLVDGASEPEDFRKEHNKKDTWRQRKAHTVDRIRDADRDLKLLSCCDKLSNIRDIIRDYRREGDTFWSKFNATKDEQRWYYTSMLGSFAHGDSIEDTIAYLEFSWAVKELFG
jgi:(p)ppGpp synthase/HD superfamily hydrolase